MSRDALYAEFSETASWVVLARQVIAAISLRELRALSFAVSVVPFPLESLRGSGLSYAAGIPQIVLNKLSKLCEILYLLCAKTGVQICLYMLSMYISYVPSPISILVSISTNIYIYKHTYSYIDRYLHSHSFIYRYI